MKILSKFVRFLFAVWEAIMEDHAMKQAYKKPTTKAPILVPSGEYERNPLFDGVDDEKTVKQISDFVSGMDSENESFDDQTRPTESSYAEPSNQLPSASTVDFQYDSTSLNAPSTNYLTGPMVVRVRPDGRPVEEDQRRPLPQDDDREAMTIDNGYFPSPERTLSEHLLPPKKTDTSVYRNYRIIQRSHRH